MTTQAEALAQIGDAEQHYPTCPCCFDECNWEDGFVCQGCGLYWANDLTRPQYLDSEAQPCDGAGVAPKVRDDGRIIVVSDCLLPTGHASRHHHAYRLADETEVADA